MRRIEIGTSGTAGDSSEKEQTDGALVRGEEMYRQLFASVSESIFLFDLDTLEIVDANPAAERLYGYSRDELLRLKIIDISNDPQATIEGVGAQGAGVSAQAPLRCKSKDGTIFPVETSRGDFASRKRRLGIGAARDISRRVRAEGAQAFLIETTEILSSSLDRRVLLSRLAALAIPPLGDGCGIVVDVDDGMQFEAVAHVDPAKEELLKRAVGRHAGEASWSHLLSGVLATGKPVLISDITAEKLDSFDRDDGVVRMLKAMELRSLMAVPMVAHDRTQGVLITLVTESDRCFGNTDMALAEELAHLAALALDNARLYEKEKESAARLRALSQELQDARENERRSVARELHDEIGQGLTALKLILGSAARAAGPTSSSSAEAITVVDELLGRVRDLSLDLRPAMLDDLGLMPALRWFLGRYQARTGVAVTTKSDGMEVRRWPPPVETAIYRIVQEALTNVARHARTDHAEIRLWAHPDSLGLQVEDDGCGFDAEAVLVGPGSCGIQGMRERLESLGGTLDVESSPGRGCCLTALLPLGSAILKEATK